MTTTITIMMLLLAFQMIGSSQTPENSRTSNPAANVSLADASPANATISLLQLEGIWSFNLMGRGPVTAVLHQKGMIVTGSAKSEGTPPWNAVLQGFLSADLLELNMIYMGDNSIISLQLEGNAKDEMIQGSYTRVDDQGNFEDGLFTGNRIGEDLSAYAPAKIPTVEGNASALKETDATAKPVPDTTTKPVALGNPRYQDVHSLAGIVPESLGVGFVGDGTVGVGGMGLG
jgi:hypothetical protein